MSNHCVTENADHKKGHHKVKFYVTGFVLSVVLTLAAFMIVDKQWFDVSVRYIAVGFLAFAQAFIQVFCFIRSNTSREDGRWNFIAFLFTIFVIIILVGGSLWIIYNLNYNMVN